MSSRDAIAPVIGVFGGSFDPPHVGHVMLATWALASGAVDRVLVIPTYQHAFGKRSASFEQRRQMCEWAFAALNAVEVSTVEAELGGESRTFNTLQELSRREPGATFRLVIGSDILESVDRWYRWEEIAVLAPPLVVGREGYPLPPECPLVLPNVSSTALRESLSRSEDTTGRVHPRVAALAMEEKLYGGV